MASLALSHPGWLPGQLGRSPTASHCLLWPDAEKCTFSAHVFVCHPSPEPGKFSLRQGVTFSCVLIPPQKWVFLYCLTLCVCFKKKKSQGLRKTIHPVPKILGYTNTETLASLLKVTGISYTSLLSLQLLILSFLPFNSECVPGYYSFRQPDPSSLEDTPACTRAAGSSLHACKAKTRWLFHGKRWEGETQIARTE